MYHYNIPNTGTFIHEYYDKKKLLPNGTIRKYNYCA